MILTAAVGDCYVAAAGVPTPRRDHAIGKCLLRVVGSCVQLSC
jgi:hypothetical protein